MRLAASDQTRPSKLEWLRDLPDAWNETEIGRVVYVRARLGWKGLTASEYVDDGIPMLATPDIKRQDIAYSDANKITAQRYQESPEIMLAAGDVLLTKDGSTIGTVNVVRDLPGPATVNGSIAVLTPTGALDGRYLYWFIASAYAQALFDRLRGGMGVPHLFQRDINRIAMPLPPLDEQRAIADFLDRESARIETLIEEQQRLIELLQERRIAALSKYTGSGQFIPLGRVLTYIRQGSSPTCEPWPADGINEWAVLKVGCSNTGRFQPLENKRLPDTTAPQPENAVRNGEIVMSRSNTKDLVGCASVVDASYPRLLLSDLTYGLGVSDLADSRYLAYSMASSQCRHSIASMSKGSSPSMQKISQRDVREIPVHLPTLDEQHRIVAFLDDQTSKIDNLIAETEKFIELSRERRAALITAAVTGQIDVRQKVS